MMYCSKCLQPDTRPNAVFSDDGICPACTYFDLLKDVDWEERFEILQELISGYRQTSKAQFDCIIGVSGGKDSLRQALWVRDKLGLRPLLACLSYPPHQVTERGVENISNLINLGFDLVMSAPAPETWRTLMKEAFLSFTNWAKSTELALFSCVPQLARNYGIPLIFWGENPGLQLGDLKTLGRTGYDGSNLKFMNTLAGGSMDWILKTDVDIGNLNPYLYPTESEFDLHNLSIVFLGWFLRDWSLVNNGMYGTLNGLQIREDSAINTGDIFGVTSLDEDWVTLNQMIKFYKFGFGRATDYVNEEIRLGKITRKLGIEIVTKFDGACSEEYIASFCEYIQISVEEFWSQVHKSLNLDLFTLSPGGTIQRRYEVGFGI